MHCPPDHDPIECRTQAGLVEQLPKLPPTMASRTPTSGSAPPLTPEAGPSAPPPSGQMRPSTAIQQGADRLTELIEHEKSMVAHLYHKAMKGLEANHKKHQENTEVMFRSIDRKVEKKDAKINELQVELHRTRQMALNASSELEKLQKEHEALQASLTEVGLVYVDGRLQFTESVSHIVDEFIQGARIQQSALSSSLLGNNLSSSSSKEEDALSEPVGPSEFFSVLSTVMDKARQFAERLGIQRQYEKEHLESCSTNTSQKQEPVWVGDHRAFFVRIDDI